MVGLFNWAQGADQKVVADAADDTFAEVVGPSTKHLAQCIGALPASTSSRRG